MDSSSLIHLGDIRLTITLAAAVTLWLAMARAYKVAWWWSAAVAITFGVVAASKIVYLAWGLQSIPFAFKAASGHAAGVTAVIPICFYLIAESYGRSVQNLALLTGWFISTGVAFLLVSHGEHSVSETIAGSCIGASASVSTWMKLHCMRFPLSPQDIGIVLTATIVIAICAQFMPVGWWLVRAALMLSGATHVYSWEDC